MTDIITREEIPDDAALSPMIRESAKKFIVVQYNGRIYYIPLTPFLNKVIKTYKLHDTIDFLRDMLHITHIQTQETVGGQIENSISQKMSETFELMFRESLHNTVQEKLNEAYKNKLIE